MLYWGGSAGICRTLLPGATGRQIQGELPPPVRGFRDLARYRILCSLVFRLTLWRVLLGATVARGADIRRGGGLGPGEGGLPALRNFGEIRYSQFTPRFRNYVAFERALGKVPRK